MLGIAANDERDCGARAPIAACLAAKAPWRPPAARCPPSAPWRPLPADAEGELDWDATHRNVVASFRAKNRNCPLQELSTTLELRGPDTLQTAWSAAAAEGLLAVPGLRGQTAAPFRGRGAGRLHRQPWRAAAVAHESGEAPLGASTTKPEVARWLRAARGLEAALGTLRAPATRCGWPWRGHLAATWATICRGPAGQKLAPAWTGRVTAGAVPDAAIPTLAAANTGGAWRRSRGNERGRARATNGHGCAGVPGPPHPRGTLPPPGHNAATPDKTLAPIPAAHLLPNGPCGPQR